MLILINDEFYLYLRNNFKKKTRRKNVHLFDIDISQFEPNELVEHIPESRLLCSNSYRIRSLNLVLYEQVVKTNDRFKLLMAIASKRYSGMCTSD